MRRRRHECSSDRLSVPPVDRLSQPRDANAAMQPAGTVAGKPKAPPQAEFTEIETGKGADALERRPQPAAALAETKRR